MKKICALLLTALMLLSLSACGGGGSTANQSNTETSPAESGQAAGDSGASGTTSDSGAANTTDDLSNYIVNAGKLTMSTNAAFPPYEMTADDGSFEGIDVEIAGAIAERLGLELQIDDMDFDAALLAAQNGKSDIVMAGVSVTDERLAVMNFTDSYATGVQVVIVREGSDVTMDNLGEKMIGTQRGTTGYIYASDSLENGGYGEDHVIAYDNGITAVQALLNGQVDCVIIDSAPAQSFVASNAGLAILEGEWVQEEYAIGIAKDNLVLLDAVNQAIAALKADGTIQQIIDKYISA